MGKLNKLIGYLILQEAFPIKKKGNGKQRDIPEEEETPSGKNLKKAKEKVKDKSVGVPTEAKMDGREPVHPFKGGASIGRARADILDQYDRDEINDPRERLKLIDKLIDELLADWTSNEVTIQHGELFKYGMEHGHDDRANMLGKVRKIEDLKKKKSDMAFEKAKQDIDAAKKQEEDEKLKNAPFAKRRGK